MLSLTQNAVPTAVTFSPYSPFKAIKYDLPTGSPLQLEVNIALLDKVLVAFIAAYFFFSFLPSNPSTHSFVHSFNECLDALKKKKAQ